jgi:hypothetical protein
MRGSLGGLPLRAALTRGAVVTAANWPLVLIQFAVVSIYRLAVSVPVVGGAFVVAVVAGADVRTLLAEDVRAAAGLVAAALADRPGALATFVVAVGLVAVGGASVVFLIQAGTASLLVTGARQAAAVQPSMLRPSILRAAGAFGIARFIEGTRRFGRRFLLLGVWLYVSYAALGLLALTGLRAALSVTRGESWEVAWGLGAILIASVFLIAVAVLNLVYALLQVIIATDDCRLSQAVSRLHTFVRHDARQVVGVFAVVAGLVLLTWAASLVAAAGLALVAWVPIVGLAVVPLQIAAWLVRGVVFHYMELGAWAAYQTHYRPYGGPS